MKLPDGVGLGGSGNSGYACSKCGAVRMNSKVAQNHNCKKTREKTSKVGNNLTSPIGVFHKQGQTKSQRSRNPIR